MIVKAVIFLSLRDKKQLLLALWRPNNDTKRSHASELTNRYINLSCAMLKARPHIDKLNGGSIGYHIQNLITVEPKESSILLE